MSRVRDRQKRLVAKSLNGSAAVNARVINASAGTAAAVAFAEARELLSNQFTPRDSHRLTGLSLTVLQALGHECGNAGERPGRAPSQLKKHFVCPHLQLWLSLFLTNVERARVCQDKDEDLLSSTLVDALHATLATGAITLKEVDKKYISGRYLLLAIEKLETREIYFYCCRRCGTRALRSTETYAGVPVVHESRPEACPMCRYVHDAHAPAKQTGTIDDEAADADTPIAPSAPSGQSSAYVQMMSAEGDAAIE